MSDQDLYRSILKEFLSELQRFLPGLANWLEEYVVEAHPGIQYQADHLRWLAERATVLLEEEDRD